MSDVEQDQASEPSQPVETPIWFDMLSAPRPSERHGRDDQTFS